MDVVALLLFEELNTARLGWEHPDRDVYFSSKGHDVPGLYAALFASGVDPARAVAAACVASAGSTGIRTSGCRGSRRTPARSAWGSRRARGIAWAKRHLGRGGRVVVMVGDGELQEGQNYEGLQAAAHEGLAGLTVIVDRNELQSDKPTDEIVSLGVLEEPVPRVRLARPIL